MSASRICGVSVSSHSGQIDSRTDLYSSFTAMRVEIDALGGTSNLTQMRSTHLGRSQPFASIRF
jgi:hypothetical protein